MKSINILYFTCLSFFIISCSHANQLKINRNISSIQDDCLEKNSALARLGVKTFSNDEMNSCFNGKFGSPESEQDKGKNICTIYNDLAGNFYTYIGKRYEHKMSNLNLGEDFGTFDFAFEYLSEKEKQGECQFIQNDKLNNTCKIIDTSSPSSPFRYAVVIKKNNSLRALDTVVIGTFQREKDALKTMRKYIALGACSE